jgi:hypothetical protein
MPFFSAANRLPVECAWRNRTGICSSTSAYRRFREWPGPGMFDEFWRLGLLAADALDQIDWLHLSLGEKFGRDSQEYIC